MPEKPSVLQTLRVQPDCEGVQAHHRQQKHYLRQRASPHVGISEVPVKDSALLPYHSFPTTMLVDSEATTNCTCEQTRKCPCAACVLLCPSCPEQEGQQQPLQTLVAAVSCVVRRQVPLNLSSAPCPTAVSI